MQKSNVLATASHAIPNKIIRASSRAEQHFRRSEGSPVRHTDRTDRLAGSLEKTKPDSRNYHPAFRSRPTAKCDRSSLADLQPRLPVKLLQMPRQNRRRTLDGRPIIDLSKNNCPVRRRPADHHHERQASHAKIPGEILGPRYRRASRPDQVVKETEMRNPYPDAFHNFYFRGCDI